jgi:hypothetical protein
MNSYIIQAQKIDTAFSTIKQAQSITQPEEIVENLGNFEKKNVEIFSMLNQTNNIIENLEISLERERDEILELMNRISKQKEKINSDISQEANSKKKIESRLEVLGNEISDYTLGMDKALKSAINMYKFLIEKQLNFQVSTVEPTFKDNVDFEKIPIANYLSWVEDVAYKMC